MSTFYPAINGRATSQLGISRLLFQIHHDQQSIQDLQSQLSTGRRILKPSEDPGAAIRALAAQRQLEFKSQIDDNLQSADTLLSVTESTLAQAQTILNEMRGIAVLAADSTLSSEEKDAFVAQIQAAIGKLTELGNAKFRDQYIFSGSEVEANPLHSFGDSVRFSGNEEQLRTITDFASTVAANITAEDAFGVRSDRIVSSVDLNPSVTADTPLSHLNRGEGVAGGAVSFSDGVELIEIDLANAYDLNDVLNEINNIQLSGRSLSATLTADGIDIEYQDGLGGLLRVAEVGSGVTAKALGISNVGTIGISPVTGTDLNPIATKETQLSQLFAGTGINIGDSFQITQGSETYFIQASGLNTVEDLINRIHLSGAQVTAALDPTGRFLSIQSTESGTALSIGENGSDLASVLGIRTFDLDTSLSALNFGQGIYANGTNDEFILTRSDGTDMTVDLAGVQNVSDVISRINNHVDNFTPALRIVASLETNGNGIVLTAPTGAQDIRVRAAGGSQTAIGLGLVSRDTTETVGSVEGSDTVIRGLDVSGVEVEGVFTSLIRMRQALENDTPEDLIRLTDALDDDIHRLSLSRSLVGTRQQAIAQTQDLSAEQQLQLTQIESEEIDADLAQVISELAAREAALQASLQLMGQTTRLTLFDYI